MPKTKTTTDTASGLFDVTEFAQRTVDGVLEKVPLDELALAPNPRKQISPEGIDRLAGMLMRTGQLIPVIGYKPDDSDKVLVFDGQRRFLAAQRSKELAGSEGYENLKPVAALIVLLLDHEPTPDEIARIQAQANQREELSLQDQQEQFRDCWEARTGLGEDDRILAVCHDLGISPKKAHNLRRQLALPEVVRTRVADRPAGRQLSVTLANRLADMHDVPPQLAEAVADRISSSELHEQALRDPSAFVHKTVVEDEDVYAVRVDLGAMLDAHDQIERARQHLTDEQRKQLDGVLSGAEEEVDDGKGGKKKVKFTVDQRLDKLAKKAKTGAIKVRVDEHLRDRAANGRYAWVHTRGEDYANAVYVVDPVFVIAAMTDAVEASEIEVARDETFFGGAGGPDDAEVQAAAEEEAKRKEGERQRAREGFDRNLGLGNDIGAGLMEPTDKQMQALKALICHLLVEHYTDALAYGAGWTSMERMQPVGDTGRYEPRSIDAIVDAELQRALEDSDPLRGIARLTARFAAAFVLDPAGVPKTKALGTERMGRKLRDALPGGDSPQRSALWEFMRPMLSPALVEINRDEFVTEDGGDSTVDLDAHRGDTGLDDLDLGEDDVADAA